MKEKTKVRKILQRYIKGYTVGYIKHKRSYEYLDSWHIEGDPDWFHTKNQKNNLNSLLIIFISEKCVTSGCVFRYDDGTIFFKAVESSCGGFGGDALDDHDEVFNRD